MNKKLDNTNNQIENYIDDTIVQAHEKKIQNNGSGIQSDNASKKMDGEKNEIKS